MSRFRGQIPHSLDTKGRVSIPSRFREILREKYNEQLLISSREKCLVAYPLQEWEKLEDRLLQLPQFSRDVKDYQRTFLSSAQECPVDGQGRILIPPELRGRAGLKDKVLFVGMLSHFEIWDQAVFEEEHASKRDQIAAMEHALSTQYGI
ncbi:MAG: division/cell wall cluster transcriptional repressor MraZ [bacterium]